MCVLNLKFWITQISKNIIFLIQDLMNTNQWRKSSALNENTSPIYMDFSSNLRYILTTYRKVRSIQITVFCYCAIFSYTDSYHPHKSLDVLFFKTVHIQFHQAVQPSDKFYPSCIPYLLKEDCNTSIFGGKTVFYFLHFAIKCHQ